MAQGDGFILKENGAGGKSGKGCQMPGVTFSTFVLSLSTSALMQMGEIADPATGQMTKDLGLARYTIDLMIMIQEKTRGNLDHEEDNLIKSLLHDLRLAYVKAKG